MDESAIDRVNSLRKKQLVFACITMFALGVIYGWSVISAPIADEFQWDPTTLAFTFTLLMWVFSVSGFFGAKVALATSVRVSLSISACFLLLTFFSTSVFVQADTPWVLYITYGVFGGLGVGFAYPILMGVGIAWFPERVGTISGTLLLCYGVSTMVLSSVAAWLFSLMYWRLAFRVLAVVVVAIVVIGAVVLRWPTDEERALLAKPDAAEQDEVEPRSVPSGKMVRTPVFWSYAMWMITASTVALGVASSVNQIALEAGALPVVAVAIVGVYSVGNGFGRLLFGFIFDALGVFRTILIVSICFIVASFLNAVGLAIGSVPITAVGLVLVGLSLGGTAVCASSFAADAFGPRYYASNMAIVNWSTIPAALIGPMINSALMAKSGTYFLGMVIGVILSGVAIILACVTGTLLKRWKAEVSQD